MIQPNEEFSKCECVVAAHHILSLHAQSVMCSRHVTPGELEARNTLQILISPSQDSHPVPALR